MYVCCECFTSNRGDADRPDDKGLTPLHVAAQYGNTAAAEVMLNKDKGVNLWALDNQGRTAARVAALHKKAECCRFLDTLAIRWQMQNQDYAEKMQTKAMKELAKRAEKISKGRKEERRDPKRVSYDHSTVPSGGRSSPGGMQSSSATQLIPAKGKKHSTQAEMLRQNFELRSSSSADQLDSKSTAADDDESGVLRPAGVRTGPLINNLKSLVQLQPPNVRGGISQESGFASASEPPTAGSSRRSSGSGHGVPDTVLSAHPIVIENDSPLATFLQSLGLMDHIQLLHREKLDLEALALCEEKDLTDIGVPLGPRKKILNAVQRRQALLKKPGRMTDTEL